MKVIIIVAFDENYVMGDGDKIPWHISEDFKLFKEYTLNNSVIMGRKTWESLRIKPLPKRDNIVITRNKNYVIEEDAVVLHSLQDAIEKVQKKEERDIYIIGGSSIYKEAMDFTDYLYISHVKGTHKGDVFFPRFDYDNWKVIKEKEYDEFVFKIYEKIKN